MPSSTDGFTGSEIVSRVTNYVGNTSTNFKTYLEQTLPLAEFRFCKMHDWLFLHKAGLSLPITNGTPEYTLNSATIGYYMSAENVELITDSTAGIVLKRVDLNQIRRFDPENDDGTSSDGPAMWAPVGDNAIRIWPPTFGSRTLTVDGKISPPALTNLANFPTIPYRYQESFIEYVISMALDRENDGRASQKKSEALALIQQDIKDDLRQLSNSDNPRFKSSFEDRYDGTTGQFNALFSPWDYDY